MIWYLTDNFCITEFLDDEVKDISYMDEHSFEGQWLEMNN